MNWLRILYHLLVVWILVFIASMLYIEIYTDNWKIAYIYDELKQADFNYQNEPNY